MENLFTNQRGIQSSGSSLKKGLIPNLTYKVEVITPEIAREYLTHNKQNRPLSRYKIREYVTLMINGKWILNPQDAIIFDRYGNLMNGQHRLSAVIESGMSIEFVVGRGADPNSFHVMDVGKNRSTGDIFAIAGVPNATNISTIINRYFTTRRGHKTAIGGGGKAHIRTNADIAKIDYLNEYYSDEAFWQNVVNYSRRCSKKANYIQHGDVGGLYAFLVKEKYHDEAVVKAFFEELVFGGMTINAIVDLRMVLQNEKSALRKLPPPTKYSLFAAAWNSFVKKKYKARLHAKDIIDNNKQIDFI